MKRIPIQAAKDIAKKYEYDQVVITARKIGEGAWYATYGKNKENCDVAAKIGNVYKKLESMELAVINANVTFEWFGPFPPAEDCPYDHVVAETPFRKIFIEWKSWKEDTAYTTDLPWGEFICEDSLDEAKTAVSKSFIAMVKKIANT